MNVSDAHPAADANPSAGPAEARFRNEPAGRPYTVPMPPDPRRKSPGLAALLSVVPGLGQVYVGYYQRGFIHAITAFSILALLSWEDNGGGEALAPLLGPFLMFFWLYNIIDAGRRASLLNFSLAGVDPIELPSDFRAPGFGGSIAGGIALMVFGGIALAHLRFGMPIEWLQSWWPVVPFAFGTWLVVKALRDRGKQAA